MAPGMELAVEPRLKEASMRSRRAVAVVLLSAVLTLLCATQTIRIGAADTSGSGMPVPTDPGAGSSTGSSVGSSTGWDTSGATDGSAITVDPNTDFDVIDAFDLDPNNNNSIDDQSYLDYYDELADDAEQPTACDETDADPMAGSGCDNPTPVQTRLITFKNYCKIRPGVHSMIVQLEQSKDMTWFQVVDGAAAIATKIADLFGVPADHALPIAEYLVGKSAAIKKIDDLILALKQWEAAMGKDVCSPVHPENENDPDKGSRIVGQWSACKILAPLDHNFTPKYCNVGGLNSDKVKDLQDDCDTSCRANGAVNSTTGLTLAACKTSCVSTMKAICQIAFSPEKGKAAEQPSRWARVRDFCDNLGP